MKKITVITGFFLCMSAISFAQSADVLKSDAISAETQENYELAAKTYEDAVKAFKEQNITDTVCMFRAGFAQMKQLLE